MSTKKLLALTGVFLTLLAFVVFFERKQPNSEERARAAKRLADFKADDVVSVTIERPDLPKVELVRKAKGRWTVTNPPASPADGLSADALLADLARLEVVGETRTSFDPKEYGLEAPKAKATVAFADKSSRVFSFGAPIPGTDAVAAAAGGVFGAVKFAPLAALTKPVDEYRSKRLFDVPIAGDHARERDARPEHGRRRAGGEGAGRDAGHVAAREACRGPRVRVLRRAAPRGPREARGSTSLPSLPDADLARVGLAPPLTTVVLDRGAEKVATIGFGAQKAEGASGRMYAKAGGLVVVIDDRVREDFDKELSAYRESRVAPVETFTLRRVAFTSDDLRAGADKVDGQWRSSGRDVTALHAEGLAGVLARAEGRGFVPTKPGKAPPEKPLATVDVAGEAGRTTWTAAFYPAPAGSSPELVAVHVTGRPERLLVDRSGPGRDPEGGGGAQGRGRGQAEGREGAGEGARAVAGPRRAREVPRARGSAQRFFGCPGEGRDEVIVTDGFGAPASSRRNPSARARSSAAFSSAARRWSRSISFAFSICSVFFFADPSRELAARTSFRWNWPVNFAFSPKAPDERRAAEPRLREVGACRCSPA